MLLCCVNKRWVSCASKSHTPDQADFIEANANVILALYKDEHPKDYSAPTIVIAEKDNEVGAAVVRTCYNKTLKKTEMSTMFRGSSCSSDFKALESLYKRSSAKLARAIELSKNDEGFDFWDDL